MASIFIFDWWVGVLLVLYYCMFAFVVLFQLLVSVAPQFAPKILRHKAITLMVLMMELLVAVLLCIIAWSETQDYFFPAPPDILSPLVNTKQ
jgi:uncharacterized membrane protein